MIEKYSIRTALKSNYIRCIQWNVNELSWIKVNVAITYGRRRKYNLSNSSMLSTCEPSSYTHISTYSHKQTQFNKI